MKRLLGVLVVAACAAATLTALSGAAPDGRNEGECADRQGGDDTAEAARRHQGAEPLDRWRSRRAAVRLHQRPGPERRLELSRSLAGSPATRLAARASFVCAPTPTREPLLTSGRVDLVISTFTYTRDRDTRIDFARVLQGDGPACW